VVKRKVAILGSTGSIGAQALDVVARHPERFDVVGLAAGSRVRELAEQCRTFAPRVASCASADDAAALAASLPAGTRVASGADGLMRVAVDSGADVLLAATDGAIAFDAVFAAAERGITLAVANKELIVAAGELLLATARAGGAAVLPVDSEHSALFQCLVGEPPERVATLVLTASGGPFWEADAATMRDATVADALKHPTWAMGTKNTVDSATMMNKGLEVIEASRLFGVPPARIEVLVHRTSVAHAFVVFSDGNIKGQFALPDMRLPIGYALAYPDRLDGVTYADAFAALGGGSAPALSLRFERPDPQRFPCLELAYDALRRGGTAPAALSAANEVAVEAFVEGRLPFGGIADVVGAVLAQERDGPLTLAAVRAADRAARTRAATLVGAYTGRPAAPRETESSAGMV
jgi:1-deoxy-D-xylulose-5-phosphate reductoisomerase